MITLIYDVVQDGELRTKDQMVKAKEEQVIRFHCICTMHLHYASCAPTL